MTEAPPRRKRRPRQAPATISIPVPTDAQRGFGITLGPRVSHLTWVFDAKEFGAVGDGITDDKKAIAACDRAAKRWEKRHGQGEAVIWYDPGIYRIGDQLLVPLGSGVGAGIGPKGRKAAIADGDFFARKVGELPSGLEAMAHALKLGRFALSQHISNEIRALENKVGIE